MLKTEHNVETGEIIIREATLEEMTQLEKDIQDSRKFDIIIESNKNKKAALLAKLGITEEEAKLLLS